MLEGGRGHAANPGKFLRAIFGLIPLANWTKVQLRATRNTPKIPVTR